jgi:quinol-cytochrome oxidoreductase complex cytochrome b subunit
LPFPLLEPYNPLGSTPPGIKPEWYFYFVYYPLELLPFWVILLASGFIGLVLVFTPWIFRGTSRKTLSFISILATVYLVVMTLFGEQIYHLFKS